MATSNLLDRFSPSPAASVTSRFDSMHDMSSADQSLCQLRTATDRLLSRIEGLPDAVTRGPSILPGWTRGHVLTHLARNAEGGTRLLGWARTGVPSYEYASLEARSAAIEEGAARPAAVLIDDVRQTAVAFGQAAVGMPPGAWQRVVRYTAGQEPRAEVIVPSRLAEVLIHLVDLDIGYCPADWPPEFVADTLPRVVEGFNHRAEPVPRTRLEATDAGRAFNIGSTGPDAVIASGPEHELLAWLLGRSNGRVLSTRPGTTLPTLPAAY
jgi:maleylpyruvate isomerase